MSMATKRDIRTAHESARVKIADREKVREISKKIRKRDAELLKRLAR
jgi:hypothetical protein